MSEIKTLNGYSFADETARASIKSLSEENGLLSNALANMTIEGYEQDSASGFFDVKDLAEKHEGEYCYESGTIKSVAIASWNWYALPVNAGEKYSVTTKYGGSTRACYLADDGGNVKERYPAVKEEFGAVDTFEFTIPDGITMLYCNEQPSAQVLMLKKAGKLSGVPHFKRTESSFAESDHLCGKLLACVGDSITEATNPEGGYFKNYAEIAAERHGMRVYKDGKGGSTMANTADHRPFCVDRYLNVPEYDILTIWFGWNDAAYSQIGTIDDTTDTTYYGAYKKVLEHFITTYPTKKIGLIVPYGNASVEPFRVAVRALSEMYGVPCLDLADGKQCSLLWGTANAAQEARRAALTYDSTHPNQAGHEYLSTMYEEFIKRL